jgi:hypothetical protein
MKLVLESSQLKTLSEICINIGQVFFASFVISPFVLGFEKINWIGSVVGLLLTLIFWSISLILVKEGQ